jgi:hypothetical protein
MLLGLLNRIPFLGYVAFLGWSAAAAAGWLYKEQVELTARVESGCQAAVYKGALDQAVEQMKRQAEIHQNWRLRMQQDIAKEGIARSRAEAIAGEAMQRYIDSQRALQNAEKACLDDPADADLIASLRE